MTFSAISFSEIEVPRLWDIDDVVAEGPRGEQSEFARTLTSLDAIAIWVHFDRDRTERVRRFEERAKWVHRVAFSRRTRFQPFSERTDVDIQLRYASTQKRRR